MVNFAARNQKCSRIPRNRAIANLIIIMNMRRIVFSCVLMAACVLTGAAQEVDKQMNMPLFQTKFTADPSPLVVGDTLFLYTSHDASPEEIPDI